MTKPDHSKEFKYSLEAALAEFGIEGLSSSKLDQLVKHYSLMCQWNQHVNLTRITDPVDAARLHYAECLFGERFIGDARALLDIGSGAGFPGVPLAVMRSDIQVTAVEANQKKALFLNEVREALGLANFQVLTARIEDLDWTSNDLLTSRALDRAEEVLGSVAGHLRPPQRLMLYCAPDLAERLASHLPDGFRAELHPIPGSEARMVALFSNP
jgi:16S rRNA (guanine527-N7)-methyltransferase